MAASRSSKMCVRNHTCDRCGHHATLPVSTLVAAVRNKRIQFWGDSVQAQMECDLRVALNSVAQPVPLACNLMECGAHYPSLNASSRYFWVGCPHQASCSVSNQTIVEMMHHSLVKRAQTATHIVFNIGSHYESYSGPVMSRSLGHFHRVLSHVGASVIVRSQSDTHFPTADGMLLSEARTNIPNTEPSAGGFCVPHRPRLTLHFTEVEIRRLAGILHAPFLDVLALSDYPNAHPSPTLTANRYSDDLQLPLYHTDCRHFCQNCGIYRAWNSQLVSALIVEPNAMHTSAAAGPLLWGPPLKPVRGNFTRQTATMRHT